MKKILLLIVSLTSLAFMQDECSEITNPEECYNMGCEWITLYEEIGKGLLLEKQYNFHELHQQFIKKYPKLFTKEGECVVGGVSQRRPIDDQAIQREVLKLINHILLNKEIIIDIFYRRETMDSRERHRYIHKTNGILGEFRHKFKKEKYISEFRGQIHRYLQFKKNTAVRRRNTRGNEF